MRYNASVYTKIMNVERSEPGIPKCTSNYNGFTHHSGLVGCPGMYLSK